MSEQRFTYKGFKDNDLFGFAEAYDNGKKISTNEMVDLLNEQQATIRRLQDLCGESDGENAKLRMKNNELQGQINRLNYIIEELRKDNYKRFEKINELKAKLKEKEEDERLYANEIVELRKTNEEWLEFKELGGDY